MGLKARLAAPKTAVVIGGGWAGCAAAVELARAGCKVTLFEAARTLGGRARAVEAHGTLLDNGQHILLGAYSATLALLKTVGVDPAAHLLHLPLQMCYPGDTGMEFVAARLPAPLHVAAALLRARGLSGADKLSLARFSTSARWMDWTLYTDCSVTELLERFDQTERLTRLMWRPLCLAALNTQPERASAQVFLHVLRDSLGAKRAASDMLLPRSDLTTLLPKAAGEYIERAGGTVRTGARVAAIAREQDTWRVQAVGNTVGGSWILHVDALVVACTPPAAAELLGELAAPALRGQLLGFDYEAISTCYLQYPPGTRLARPLYALLDDPEAGRWGQFVFDRGQLDAAQAGLLAVVISASGEAAALGQARLGQLVAAQLASVFGRTELGSPLWCQVITEKRATFACTPGLKRPPNSTGLPGLALAGDYTASDYPGTLEAAVRSGVGAAEALRQSGAAL